MLGETSSDWEQFGSGEDDRVYFAIPARAKFVKRGRQEQLAHEFAIAALHQFSPLGNEPSRAVLQKLTMGVPFLSNFFLSKDRNRGLSVGLALEALIERDQGLMKTFVGSERRLCNRL